MIRKATNYDKVSIVFNKEISGTIMLHQKNINQIDFIGNPFSVVLIN